MKGIFRIAAVFTVVFCLLLPLQGLADAQDMSISVQWTDAAGNTQFSAPASLMSADPGDYRFWITVPFDAPLDALVLQISDLTGAYTAFMPGTGEFLTGVADAVSGPGAYVSVSSYDAQGNPGPVFLVYISTADMSAASWLDQPVQPAQPALVTVRYLNDQGLPLMQEKTLTLEPGEYTIEAEPIEGYIVSGPASCLVTVDEAGTASMTEINFYYVPEAPAVVEADVLVRYLDEQGAPVLPEETLTLQAGDNLVQARAVDGCNPISVNILVRYLDESNYQPLRPDETVTLHEGEQTITYQPIDGYALSPATPESVKVNVGPYGADRQEVVFLYSRAVVSAAVTVRFADENGTPLMNEMTYNLDAGQHVVTALPIDHYDVVGESAYPVTVDQSGANPSEITFVYARRIDPVNVTVRYMSAETGEPLAGEETLLMQPGTTPLQAQQIEGYVLSGDETVPVTVDAEGAHPGEVTFYYTRVVLPAEVIVHYVDDTGAPIAGDTSFMAEPPKARVFPGAEISPDDYLLTDPSWVDVNVTADGAMPGEVTFVYQRVAKSVDVVVHYRDDLDTPIAQDTVRNLTPGIHSLEPDAIIPQDEYALMEPFAYQVTVDVNGANPSEITFRYQRLVRPVTVTVHYQDEAGNTIAPDTYQTYGEGEHTITPDAQMPQENYIMEEPFDYPLIVNLEGGSLKEVTFYYLRVVHPAQITVHYTDDKGQPLSPDTLETVGAGAQVVYPNPENLPAFYYLKDNPDGFIGVRVTADGASPSEITFVYEYREPEPAVVPVRYQDAETLADIASSGSILVPYGQKVEVSAVPAPEDLLPNYELISDPNATVSMDNNGVVSANEVVFLYRFVAPATQEPMAEPTAEPTPAPTPEPTAEPTQEPTQEPTPTPAPVFVLIRFVDEDGGNVAEDSGSWCAFGETEIWPAPQDLPEGYSLVGPESITVRLDENGPDPAEAVFVYSRYVPDAPAPKVALVYVKYVAPDEHVFYSTTVPCTAGLETSITLDTDQVDPAWQYELASEETVVVKVDQDGTPSPAEVVFRFKNEEPVVIPVRYVDAATGEDVASPAEKDIFIGANFVDAAPVDLRDGYVLEGPDSVTVYREKDGPLSADEVVFTYVSTFTPTPAPTTPPMDTEMDAYCYPNGPDIRLRSGVNTADDNIIALVGTTDLCHILGHVTARAISTKVWSACSAMPRWPPCSASPPRPPKRPRRSPW